MSTLSLLMERKSVDTQVKFSYKINITSKIFQCMTWQMAHAALKHPSVDSSSLTHHLQVCSPEKGAYRPSAPNPYLPMYRCCVTYPYSFMHSCIQQFLWVTLKRFCILYLPRGYGWVCATVEDCCYLYEVVSCMVLPVSGVYSFFFSSIGRQFNIFFFFWSFSTIAIVYLYLLRWYLTLVRAGDFYQVRR